MIKFYETILAKWVMGVGGWGNLILYKLRGFHGATALKATPERRLGVTRHWAWHRTVWTK